MNVTKCDICKKEIEGKAIRVGFGFWVDYIEACKDCGAPVVKFWEKHKSTKKDAKEMLKRC